MVNGNRAKWGGLAAATTLLLWLISEILYKRYRSWKASNLRRKRRLLGIPQSAEAANDSADSDRLLLIQVVLRYSLNLFKSLASMPGKLSNDNSTRSNRQQHARPQQQQPKRVPSSAESGSSSSVNKSDGSGVKARGRESTQDTFQQGSARFPSLLRASSLFMSHTSKAESGNTTADAPTANADADAASPASAMTSPPRTTRPKDTHRSLSSSSSPQSTSRARKPNAESKKEQPQHSPSSGKKSAKEAEEFKVKPAVSVRSIGIQVSPPSHDLELSSITRPAMQSASAPRAAEDSDGRADGAKPSEAQIFDKRQPESRPHSSMLPPPPYDDSHRQNHHQRSPEGINGGRLGSSAMTARSSSSSSSETSYQHLQEAQSSRSISSSSSPSRVNRKTRAAINRQTSRVGVPGLPSSSSIQENLDVAQADLSSELDPSSITRDDASNPNSPSTSIATSTSVPTSSYIESTDPSISGRSASMSVSTAASSTASSSRHTLEGYTSPTAGTESHKPYCFHSGFQSGNNAAEGRHSRDARHAQSQAQHYLPTPPDSERKMRLHDHGATASSRSQSSPALLPTYGTNGQHVLLQPVVPFTSPSLRVHPNNLPADYVMDPGSQAALLFAYQQQQGQQQQISYIHSSQGYSMHQPHAQQIQQHLQPHPSQIQQQQVPASTQTRPPSSIEPTHLAPPSPTESTLVFPSLHSPSLLTSSEPTSSRSVSPQPSLQYATALPEASAQSTGYAPSLLQQQQQQQQHRLGVHQLDILGNLQVVQAQLEYNQQAQAQMQAHYLANAQQLNPQQIYVGQLQQQQQQLQQAYMDQQARPATPLHQSYNQPLVSPMLSPYGMHVASPVAYSPSIASPHMHSPYAGSPAPNWSDATARHGHGGTSGNTSLGSISTSGGTLRRKTASMTFSDVPSSSIPPPSPMSSSASASGQRKKGSSRRTGARTRIASLNESEQYLLSPTQQSRENGKLDPPSASRARRNPSSSASLAGKRRNSANQTISSRMSQADADEAELADESVVSNDQELLNSLQDISFEDLDPERVKSTLQGMELVLERRAKELEIAKWKLKCVEVDRRDTQLEHHRALVHFAERAERAEARIRLLESSNFVAGAFPAAIDVPSAATPNSVSAANDDNVGRSSQEEEEQKDEHDHFRPRNKPTVAYKIESSPHNSYSMTTPNITAYEFSQEPSLDYPPYPFPSRNGKTKARRRKRTSDGPSPAISLDFMRRDSLALVPPSARSVTSKSSSESLSYDHEEQDQSDAEGSEEDDVEIVLDSSFSRTSSRSGTISSQAMLATPSGEKSGALGLGMMLQNQDNVASASPAAEGNGDGDERQPTYVGSVPSFSFSLLPNSPSQSSDLPVQL